MRLPSERGRDTRQIKHADLLIKCGNLRLALKDLDLDRRLIIISGCEYF
jgi:hypothetical protein